MAKASPATAAMPKLYHSLFDLRSLHVGGGWTSFVGREHGNIIVANSSTTATPHARDHQSAATGQAGAGNSPVEYIIEEVDSCGGGVMNGGSGDGDRTGWIKLVDGLGDNGGDMAKNSDKSLATSPRRPQANVGVEMITAVERGEAQ